MSEKLWGPSSERIEASQLVAFMRKNGTISDYDEFWRWSVSNRSDFWSAVWQDCKIVGQPGQTVLRREGHMTGSFPTDTRTM